MELGIQIFNQRNFQGSILVQTHSIIKICSYQFLYSLHRTTNGDINSETDSSDDEDSEEERSESSDYETECYEAYTSKRQCLDTSKIELMI